MFEHLSLAPRKRVQAPADFGKFGLLPPKGSVFLNCHTNRCKQVRIVHGLGEKITGAVFHRQDAFRNITVTGQKNNGQEAACLGKGVLEFETIEGRHSKVEHETARCVRIMSGKKFLCRGKRSHSKASRTQQTRDGPPYRRVVVYNKDGWTSTCSHEPSCYWFQRPLRIDESSHFATKGRE